MIGFLLGFLFGAAAGFAVWRRFGSRIMTMVRDLLGAINGPR